MNEHAEVSNENQKIAANRSLGNRNEAVFSLSHVCNGVFFGDGIACQSDHIN